ncbi:MAG: tRNA guanosine(34) transglycosylase Tgt [Bacteriovoracales bacterium]|nr:tRNA guanosine(34) transglycosylase Tgt [Bacteriovoracales bacterium]
MKSTFCDNPRREVKRHFRFEVQHRDRNGPARAGLITTPHGAIATPVFMPVGTHGAVKACGPEQLLGIGQEIVLANTYHLHLSPGGELIAKAKGLHRFMQWPKAILTDSGGFQIFALREKTITEEAVHFQGPQNQKITLSPETSIKVQEQLGSDIMMALDECIPYPAGRKQVETSIARTHRWLDRCIKAWSRPEQALFGIIQGGEYGDLRKRCVETVCEKGLPGHAIGGVSVGEGPKLMEEIVSATAPLLPDDRPKYVMGVGLPEDLLMLWENGVDMSDCIIPTKFARGGTLFTNRGKIRIRHRRYRRDFYPVEPNCPCSTCKRFSRAYLKHLFDANEILGQMLATVHNLAFFHGLAAQAREAILEDRFASFKRNFLAGYLGQ